MKKLKRKKILGGVLGSFKRSEIVKVFFNEEGDILVKDINKHTFIYKSGSVMVSGRDEVKFIKLKKELQ